MEEQESKAKRMRAVVPKAVLQVCETLNAGGFEAWIVGGAVRDLLLDEEPGDWDVTSDALPEQVQALFDKTIPTGIQHGTVTAVVGRGPQRAQVEITTFRGEGAYSDGRRPDSVHFGVPLEEDLRRRDFVINAMAFDPLAGRVFDPFGGALDLRNRRIRAVGAAIERFREDGLRIMRAVRFVSVLNFDLETKTEEAMEPALDVLATVAQERVRVELLKLLGGSAAPRALEIAKRSGIIGVILPEIVGLLPEGGARVAHVQGDVVRSLGALLLGVPRVELEAALRRLTVSNEERQRVIAMLHKQEDFRATLASEVALRRHLSEVGRAAAHDHLAIVGAEARRCDDEAMKAQEKRALAVLESGVPLEIRDLAINGKDVMALTGAKGKQIGEVLRELLAAVVADPKRNEADELKALAQGFTHQQE